MFTMFAALQHIYAINIRVSQYSKTPYLDKTQTNLGLKSKVVLFLLASLHGIQRLLRFTFTGAK